MAEIISAPLLQASWMLFDSLLKISSCFNYINFTTAAGYTTLNNWVMHSGDTHVFSSRLSSFWSLSLITDTALSMLHANHPPESNNQ